MKTKFAGFFIFVVFAFNGFFLAVKHRSPSTEFIAEGSMVVDTARGPASVKKEIDFSALPETEIVAATTDRMLSAAKVITGPEGNPGVSFGHFVTKNKDGKKVLACDLYRRVRLRFEAEGVAEAGEKPTMTIVSTCETEDDYLRIKPVWIPVNEIFNQKPTDGFMNYKDSVQIQLENVPSSEWPTRWILTGIRLDDGNDLGASSLVVDQKPLRVWRAKSGLLDISVRKPASN